MSKPTRWAFLHRIGKQDIVKLVVTEVPTNVPRKRLLEQMEAAGVVLHEGGVPWGNHRAVREAQWSPQLKFSVSKDAIQLIRWDTLVERAENRGKERKMTLRVMPELHTQLTMLAEREGISLQQLCERTLREAVENANA